ncbi:MAG TPA: hypothetical protein VHR43_16265, partial [Gemmatimonadales bacterium]|nr:hypothetical protein [Gemmatimonadales bacterium]
MDTSPAPQPQVLLEASELEGRSLPGDVRLEALEGESVEGWLYLATTSDGREVEALVLPANPDGPGPAPSDLVGRVRCRVRAERIEAAARFQHPQVIRILATGVTPEGHPFLVRERPSGTPLSEHLTGAGLLPPATLLSVGADAADALAAAHAAGLVHGNLSPAMVWVTTGGSGPPGVTLLGLTLGPFLQTRDEAVRLGGGHASPEQRFPIAADERSDVYSLAAVLYHALTGAAPSPEAPTDSVPRGVRSSLATALSEWPEQRKESMSAFAAALRRAAAKASPAQAGPPEPEPWERPSGTEALGRRAWLGGAAAAVAALVGLGLWLVPGRVPAPRPPFDAREPAEVAISPAPREPVAATPRSPSARDSTRSTGAAPAAPTLPAPTPPAAGRTPPAAATPPPVTATPPPVTGTPPPVTGTTPPVTATTPPAPPAPEVSGVA